MAAASFVFAQTAEQPANYDDPDAGEAANPYQIATWQNLYWLSQNSDYWDDHFVQTADIDLGDASPAIETWDGGKGWSPIGRLCPLGEGQNDSPFRGVYDGGDFSIIGLFSDRQDEDPDDPEDEAPPGVCPDNSTALFGYIVDAEIHNLHLEDVKIYAAEGAASLVTLAVNSEIDNVSASGEVYGFFLVGGLIALADGCDIKNASSSVNIDGLAYLGGLVGLSFNSDFLNSAATGDVTGLFFDEGDGPPIGPLNIAGERLADVFSGSGRVNRFISNANNRDNGPGPIIPFGGFLVGGFAGLADSGTIEKSFSSGDVQGGFGVGGFAGAAQNTTITESFSTGNVAGTEEAAGGFAGFAFSSHIHNSYHRGNVAGNEFVGGFIGGGGGTSTIGFSYSTGGVTGNTEVNGFLGFFDDDGGEFGEPGGNPILSIQNSFWDVETSGIGEPGEDNFGATGKTTEDMQDPSLFAEVWDIRLDASVPPGYPLLTWQLDTNSPPWTFGTGGIPAIPLSGWSTWITLLLMSIVAVRIAVRKLL